MLHPVKKQVYKLELSKKWKIHDSFYLSLLEQDTTREELVDNEAKLDASDDSGEYEVEAIRDSAVYTRESESGHLPGLYSLWFWIGYSEEENTWEPAWVV